MRQRFTFLIAMVLWAFALGTAPASFGAECGTPAGLQRQLANRYPGDTIVRLSDLDEHSRALFVKDHGSRCPGLVRVDFYRDGNLAWALAIIPPKPTRGEAKLVVAQKRASAWALTLLDTAKASVPVVWSLGPGKYQDVYGEKSIKATSPVIVWGEYEAWIILYAWKGESAAKIWLVD